MQQQDTNKNIFKNWSLGQGRCFQSSCGRLTSATTSFERSTLFSLCTVCIQPKAATFKTVTAEVANEERANEPSLWLWLPSKCLVRGQKLPFVSTGIAGKKDLPGFAGREGWCPVQKPGTVLSHCCFPFYPHPSSAGWNSGSKTGKKKCQVLLTNPGESHSKSPLVFFGHLLEYIMYLHTGKYKHVYRFTESTRKKNTLKKKIKIIFLMISSCSSRNWETEKNQSLSTPTHKVFKWLRASLCVTCCCWSTGKWYDVLFPTVMKV